jgi:hypothetical protein
MKLKFKISSVILKVFLVLLLSKTSVFSFEIMEEGYIIEDFTSYDVLGRPGPYGMAFDANDVLYTTIGPSPTFICRISPDGNPEPFWLHLPQVQGPSDIIWTGGTNYGDYLFVSSHLAGLIVRVGVDGDIAHFAQIPSGASALAVDKTGNYQNNMFVGSRFHEVYQVSETGQETLFALIEPPFNIYDMAFATQGRFGDLLYASLINVREPYVEASICTISPTGTIDIIAQTPPAIDLAFDEKGWLFAGDLYFVGFQPAPDLPLGYASNIFRMNEDGQISNFIQCDEMVVSMAFDSYGIMYIASWSGSKVNIHRIIRPVVLACEEMIEAKIEKELALESIEASLAAETDVLDILYNMMFSGNIGNLTDKDTHMVELNIKKSIHLESKSKNELLGSIEQLKQALQQFNCPCE